MHQYPGAVVLLYTGAWYIVHWCMDTGADLHKHTGPWVCTHVWKDLLHGVKAMSQPSVTGSHFAPGSVLRGVPQEGE